MAGGCNWGGVELLGSLENRNWEHLAESPGLWREALGPRGEEALGRHRRREGAIGVVREVQVYPGDTLDDFARDYSVSKAEILRANPQIVEGEPLREGFTLRIPFSE